MLTMGKQLTPDQRLISNTVRINSHKRYTALAGVLMTGTRKIGPTPFGTAYTNGRDEVYDARMIDDLSDAEVRYVILHENFHKMYRHLITWKWMWDIDPNIANQACDHVINLRLNADNKDGFAVMPGGEYEGLADIRFSGMNAAQVFSILRQEKEDAQKKQQEQQQDDSPDEDDDTSEQGGDGDSSPDNESGDDTGTGDDGDSGDDGMGGDEPQGQGGKGKGFDSHDWEAAEDMTEEEKKTLERDIDEAIRQGALAAGKTGAGNESIDISDLLRPQINWREVMRQFIQTTCAGNDYSTYARPNRRLMSQGVYMPTGVQDQVGELIFAFDMSGSTSLGRMRPTFMTEAQSTCDMVHPEIVRVLYWDTHIAGEEVYRDHEVADMSKNTNPVGGGGTTVECVSEHISNTGIKPQAIVIFTDGDLYGGWGSWTCPVLWVIVDNPTAVPAYGKALHVDSSLA